LAALAHQRGIVFHTDAVQAAGQLPLDVQALGVDLLSLSGHKFYGPKGVGVLYIREGTSFSSSQTGGGQEGGHRAGTQCTPLIVGLAKALQLAYQEFEARNAHFRTMRDYLIDRVLTTVPDVTLTGHPSERLSTHASFILDGLPSSALVDALDSEGIAASGASACKAGSSEPSSVVVALGYTRSQASSTLRLTVGLKTTYQEIDTAVQSLASWTERLRRKPAPVSSLHRVPA
jgi:cysteine desulfurase